MSIKKTPLTKNQLLRLYNHCNDDGKVKCATLCEVEGTPFYRIEIEYYNMGKESIYPNKDTLDYILNGVHVERNRV